jgi:hypothetical protein
MKEEKQATSGQSAVGSVIFFLAGFIPALLVGWVVFPTVLFSEKIQPVNFSHVAHQDSACEDCHTFRDDGSYAGIPKVDKCAECHESPMTDSKDEKVLVEEYIQNSKEIPWLVYAWQPDNVYFSHAPHKEKAGLECVSCHRDVSKEEKTPTFFENRLTGYSKSTMKMVDCENCHAERGAPNSCHVCHK